MSWLLTLQIFAVSYRTTFRSRWEDQRLSAGVGSEANFGSPSRHSDLASPELPELATRHLSTASTHVEGILRYPPSDTDRLAPCVIRRFPGEAEATLSELSLAHNAGVLLRVLHQ
jgi:hypothetical protein